MQKSWVKRCWARCLRRPSVKGSENGMDGIKACISYNVKSDVME